MRKERKLETRYILRLCTACVLYWEKVIPTLVPVFCVFLFYSLIALLGIFDEIGDPWRLFGLAGVSGFSIFWIGKHFSTFLPPGSQAIDRRLEEDSGLEHRPFEALQDQPVIASETAEATGTQCLWEHHQNQARDRLQNLKTRLPKKTYLSRDVFALYIPVTLLFLTLAFFFREEAVLRLERAFRPAWFLSKNTDIQIQAWLNPPAYTGQAPEIISNENLSEHSPASGRSIKKGISMLQGSTFTALLSGSSYKPSVTARRGKQAGPVQIRKLKDLTYEIKMPLGAGHKKQEILIRTRGFEQKYRFTSVQDKAPKIAFLNVDTHQKEESKEKERITIHYTAEDDYGLASIYLRIKPDPEALKGKKRSSPEAGVQDEDRIPLPFYQIGNHQLEKEKVTLSLPEHRLAGQPVILQLEAEDGLGQKGVSAPQKLVLPEQIFIDPLAKAIIEQRQKLLLSSQPYEALKPTPEKTIDTLKSRPVFATDQKKKHLGRAPKEIQKLAHMMEATLIAPESFFTDFPVYMGLQYVLSRLQRASNQKDLAGLDKELWLIAQRAELGDLADALSALKTAEERLSEGLARKVSEREISLLFDRYKTAVKRYLRVLAQEALAKDRVQYGEGGGLTSGQEDQFAKTLKAIQEAYRLGLNRDARFAAQKLRELLENMELSLRLASGGEGSESLLDEALADLLQGLGKVTAQQRDLKERTEAQAEQKKPSEMGQKNPGSESGDSMKNHGEDSVASKGGRASQNSGEEKKQDSGALQGTHPQETGENPSGQDKGRENASSKERLSRDSEGNSSEGNSSEGNSSGGSVEEGHSAGSSFSMKKLDSARQIEVLQQALVKEIEGLKDTVSTSDRAHVDRASQAMQEAAEALGEKDYQGAIAAQNKALKALRSLSSTLADRARQRPDGSTTGNLDPLGREQGETGADLENTIDQKSIKRAREILEELKRRRKDPNRPQAEIEYLERLLKRFGDS